MRSERKKLAVIGGGISGISASYVLQKKFDVTIFEASNRLGGHTNTIPCKDSSGNELHIDTGFIVLNDCNYPILHELFERWGVEIRWSDMSFSFYDPSRPFYYAGTTIFGLFAQLKNLFSPSFYLFLNEIKRFCLDAQKFINSNQLNSTTLNSNLTLGEFLENGNYSQEMCASYLYPMGAAIWSAPIDKIKLFPALAFFNFFKNHGLLSITNRPRWQTVSGGSSAYLEKFKAKFFGKIILDAKVCEIDRTNNKIQIRTEKDTFEDYDYVVLSCHADDALKILKNPNPLEEELLSAWTYQENEVVLHTDESLLPPSKHAWASWNYLSDSGQSKDSSNTAANSKDSSKAVLTYYMNLLQGVKSEDSFLVTLNHTNNIKEDKIIKKIMYHHPIYTPDSINSQKRLHELQGIQNTFYSGSYFGNGFHEDGARSGSQVGLYHNITL